MTPTRRKQFETAVRRKRLKFEDGKWWAICQMCTGRRDENVYYVVRKRKAKSIETCCMDFLLCGSYTCNH